MRRKAHRKFEDNSKNNHGDLKKSTDDVSLFFDMLVYTSRRALYVDDFYRGQKAVFPSCSLHPFLSK